MKTPPSGSLSCWKNTTRGERTHHKRQLQHVTASKEMRGVVTHETSLVKEVSPQGAASWGPKRDRWHTTSQCQQGQVHGHVACAIRQTGPHTRLSDGIAFVFAPVCKAHWASEQKKPAEQGLEATASTSHSTGCVWLSRCRTGTESQERERVWGLREPRSETPPRGHSCPLKTRPRCSVTPQCSPAPLLVLKRGLEDVGMTGLVSRREICPLVHFEKYTEVHRLGSVWCGVLAIPVRGKCT